MNDIDLSDRPPSSLWSPVSREENPRTVMHSLFALTAPVALILPVMAGAGSGMPVGDTGGASAVVLQCDAAPALGEEPPVGNALSAFRNSMIARQVRIEQRVVIRITPQPPAARQNLLADLPQREIAPRFEERKKEKCVALEGIAGVQTGSGNRLVLFLRDQRMISVNLEKACHARDFYSGFYVEKSKDGRLCVERDKLQSRTGARCEVEAMRQLVAVRN